MNQINIFLISFFIFRWFIFIRHINCQNLQGRGILYHVHKQLNLSMACFKPSKTQALQVIEGTIKKPPDRFLYHRHKTSEAKLQV
jgi:hypothetical protein